MSRELAARLRSRGIIVNCCHPGAVATNIGISRDTGFGKAITGMLAPFFQTPEQGGTYGDLPCFQQRGGRNHRAVFLQM